MGSWPMPVRRAVVVAPPRPAIVARSPTSVMGASPAPVWQSRIVGQPLAPLGPERYYPGGIAPLRPEFMHPESTDTSAR